MRHARGVGLIEVLIAVLVMAIGMLGIAALQATSLRNSQSSLERGNAVIQSYAILDSIRANPVGFANKDYDVATTLTCAPVAGTTLATDDVNVWLRSMKSMLGDRASTCGKVSCDYTSKRCNVTVQWDDSRGSDGSGAQTILTVGRI